MPTIIDSLIVTLGLDPRGFNQGQKQAVQSLQQLQTQSVAINKLIQSGTNALSQPVQNANKHLQNLSSQANRTGSAVAAGAKAGAAGLNQIVSAGLAAYTTLKLVQSTLESIKNATTRGAEAGRIAAEIGGGTQWTDAFAKAANVATNVSPDAVKGEMAEFQKNMERWRRGQDVGGWLNEVKKAGLHLNQTDTEWEATMKASDVLSKLTPSQAAERGQAMGLGQTQRFLRGGRAAVTDATANQMSVAVTERQTKAYQDLQSAVNSVQIAYEGLVNKYIEANPGLTRAIKNFDDWLRTLQSTPEGLKQVEVAFAAVSTVIGITLVAAIGRATWAINSFWALPLFRLLSSGAFLKFLGPLGAFLGVMTPGTAGVPGVTNERNLPGMKDPFSAPPPDSRSWWKQLMYPRATDKRTFRQRFDGTSPESTTNSSGQHTGYSSPATAVAGSIISRNESKDQDVNNFMYDRPGARRMGADGVDKGYTAGGYHQMLDTNWVKYAGELGIDTKKYPRAKGSPKEMQEAVFSAMFNKEGFTPWSSAAGGPMTESKIAAARSAMANAKDTSKRSPFPPGTKFNSAGQAYNVDMTDQERSNVAASMQTIRMATAANKPWWGTRGNTNNTNSTDINGGVHIHTLATDAAGIAKTIAPEIERNVQISQFNDGLEY